MPFINLNGRVGQQKFLNDRVWQQKLSFGRVFPNGVTGYHIWEKYSCLSYGDCCWLAGFRSLLFIGASSCPNIRSTWFTFSRFRFPLFCSIFRITVSAIPALDAKSSWVNFACFLFRLTNSANFSTSYMFKHIIIPICLNIYAKAYNLSSVFLPMISTLGLITQV